MDLRELISKAQSGDEDARTELIKRLHDNGAMKQLSRYLYKNRLLEPDDVKAEFWFGVAKALVKVKWDIGNPMQHLIQRGLWQVQGTLRSLINANVIYRCEECGNIGNLRRHDDKLSCSKCNSELIQTEQITGRQVPYSLPAKEDTRSRIDLDAFRERLTEREIIVFNLIMNGTDRDNSFNYLKDVASRMRTSPQYINKVVRQIRRKLSEYLGRG